MTVYKLCINYYICVNIMIEYIIILLLLQYCVLYMKRDIFIVLIIYIELTMVEFCFEK